MRGRKKLQEEKQLVTYLKNLRFVGASLNACASSLFHKAYYADHHFKDYWAVQFFLSNVKILFSIKFLGTLLDTHASLHLAVF